MRSSPVSCPVCHASVLEWLLKRRRDEKRDFKKRGPCVCVFGQDWALQQGARGALWRGWGVCWAVAHWQDVVVAGNVAVPREVIRTL